MLDPIVQSAFVVIVAWLLTLLSTWLGFPLDKETLYTIAGAIVAYILSKLGVPAFRALFPVLVRRGLVSRE
jgi:hypothetical protein